VPIAIGKRGFGRLLLALVSTFVDGVRAILHGETLKRILVFGSRARRDGQGDSDLEHRGVCKRPSRAWPRRGSGRSYPPKEARMGMEGLAHPRPI